MSNNPWYSPILIDITNFSSAKELDSMLRSMDLPIDGYELWNAKDGAYNGSKINKFWFDPVSYWLIAFENDTDQLFHDFFVDSLSNAKPLMPGDKSPKEKNIKSVMKTYQDRMEENEIVGSEVYNLNSILDKISQNGINSLTKGERNFLDSIE